MPPAAIVIVSQEQDHPVQDLWPYEDAEVMNELEYPRADKVPPEGASQRR